MDRVEVDHVDVPPQVLPVAEGLLDRLGVPDHAAAGLGASPLARGGQEQERLGKARLDESPAALDVGVARGQLPDAVQVVGQDDGGHRPKGAVGLREAPG